MISFLADRRIMLTLMRTEFLGNLGKMLVMSISMTVIYNLYQLIIVHVIVELKEERLTGETLVFDTNDKSLVDTAPVERNIERNFASKLAPKAEKQGSNENDDDIPERKLKSGGRSRMKVRINA